MIRFLLLLLFPLVANAATFWSFDWETLPTANSNESEGIFYQGNCFEKALGDPFNSIELSTKYVRTGTYSARLYTDSKYGNHQGKRSCASMYKTETITINNVVYNKHRMEPKFAYSATGLTDFVNYQVGEERWFRYSFYFPSDEGTFNNWNTGPYSSKGMMIMQIFAQGGASGGTHEVAFILSGGPKMKVEQVYGTKADEEIFVDLGTFNLKKDAWNDVVFMHLPDYDSDGRLKVWLNCSDWANCTPVVDRSGPTSIFQFTDRYWKGGNYEMNVPVWDRAVAQYVDSHKMGKKDSETEAQMLALMADVFTTGGSGGGGGTPTATDLVFNSGTPITSSQDPLSFTATGLTDVTNCEFNGGSPVAAKFNYSTATGGVIVGPDTTGFAATGTATCYDENFTYNLTLDTTNFSNANTTDSQVTGLTDRWEYTTARRIEKTSTATSADAYLVYGTSYGAVVGDKVRFDITYSCLTTSCNNLYFDIMHNTGDDQRIRLAGTAGALTIGQAASVPLHGSSYFIRNYTLPENVYRAVMWFTATEDNNYRIRAGWNNSAPVGNIVDLHEWVQRKNWTTKELTVPVTYSVADVTAPVLSSCFINNNLADGGYRAYLGCTGDEIGGTDYAMITTSDTSPDAADVIAGTGSIWFSQKPADSTTMEFDANGMSFQDLWAWFVRSDADDNLSTVASATFDDGLGVGEFKKFKWSEAVGNKIYCFNDETNNLEAFTGTMEIAITDSDWFGHGAVVTELAYSDEIVFTDGEAEMLETDLDFGSINVLSTGAQGYNFWATDGTCRADNEIQLIVE